MYETHTKTLPEKTSLANSQNKQKIDNHQIKMRSLISCSVIINTAKIRAVLNFFCP